MLDLLKFALGQRFMSGERNACVYSRMVFSFRSLKVSLSISSYFEKLNKNVGNTIKRRYLRHHICLPVKNSIGEICKCCY